MKNQPNHAHETDVMIPLKEVLKRVQALNTTCRALRKAYLKAHPKAPLTDKEIEYNRLL